jgi:membrane-bound metal-dependent hydrolase YbcI (DUF457 family)
MSGRHERPSDPESGALMEGHSHALSGAVAGAATGLYVLHLPPAATLTLTGLTAGAALLPDIDHPDASLAESFGFLGKTFAAIVGKVSGGHRHGTHSLIGIAVFTGLAWLAVHYRHDTAARIGLAVLLSLIIAGGLYALPRVGGHLADLAAIGAAVAMTLTGTGLALVAVATGLGCAVHIAGDALTDSGVPLGWPASRYRFRFWPEPFAFTTGTAPERFIVAPALTVTLGLLAWQAVMAYRFGL